MPKQNRTSGTPFLATRRSMSRRTFLRGAGILLSLPMLDAMQPVFGAPVESAGSTPGGKPRRMLGICNNLGVLPERFFPTGSGRDYTPSPYLELLKEHRNDFTVFTGVSHPDVDGGHPADNCFLTAAPHPGRGSFRNTISLDQLIVNESCHRASDAVPVADAGRECVARAKKFVMDEFRRAHSVRRKTVGGLYAPFPERDEGGNGRPGPPPRPRSKYS